MGTGVAGKPFREGNHREIVFFCGGGGQSSLRNHTASVLKVVCWLPLCRKMRCSAEGAAQIAVAKPHGHLLPATSTNAGVWGRILGL